MGKKFFVDDHSSHVNFPDEININEHRAPTDESIKILNKMEAKAREDVIIKVADDLPNDFHFNILVCEVANLSFEQKFVLYFRINVNDKHYERKITVGGGSALMRDIMIMGGGRHKAIDYSTAVQRFFLFQLSILIAQILVELDEKAMSGLMAVVGRTGACRFSLKDVSDQLQDWEKYDIDKQIEEYNKDNHVI